MSKRLAEGDRVKTRVLSGSESVATTVIETPTLDSYMFQDDVTLIGVELIGYANVVDAHANADGALRMVFEVTRRATATEDGAILRGYISSTWTGILVIGGHTVTEQVVMFPKGQGVEIDEGESINLLGVFNWIGAGGDITVFAQAILYYVER